MTLYTLLVIVQGDNDVKLIFTTKLYLLYTKKMDHDQVFAVIHWKRRAESA